IQRVIVDGWTSAAAGAAFGVPERLVEVWVADYRRHGMASLRHERGRTIAVEIIQLTVARPLRMAFRRISLGLHRVFAADPLVQPVPLRRGAADPDPGHDRPIDRRL